MSIAATGRGCLKRRPTELSDLGEVILDRGMVIDAFVRVKPIGTEILMIDARGVIASIDTYLRLADAVNRFDISGRFDGGNRLLP